jgi:hypothetical protein
VSGSVGQGGGVDDWDKVPSFDAGEAPRRSTSSLGPPMRCFLVTAVLFASVCCYAEGHVSTKEARSAENTLAEWLSSPLEFGVAPRRVKYLTTIPTPIAGQPRSVRVHVLEYEMPDGTYGKGFVNPNTWSFAGALPYDKLTNDQLVAAYSGWAWLFGALHNGSAKSEFKPVTLGDALKLLEANGVANISVTNQYRVGDSEFFEFLGMRADHAVKGVATNEARLIYDASDPIASLPIVYTFLAKVMRDEI